MYHKQQWQVAGSLNLEHMDDFKRLQQLTLYSLKKRKMTYRDGSLTEIMLNRE